MTAGRAAASLRVPADDLEKHHREAAVAIRAAGDDEAAADVEPVRLGAVRDTGTDVSKRSQDLQQHITGQPAASTLVLTCSPVGVTGHMSAGHRVAGACTPAASAGLMAC